MRINVQIFGYSHIPHNIPSGGGNIELAEGATVKELLEKLNFGKLNPGAILINRQRAGYDTKLCENDNVMLMSAKIGG